MASFFSKKGLRKIRQFLIQMRDNPAYKQPQSRERWRMSRRQDNDSHAASCNYAGWCKVSV